MNKQNRVERAIRESVTRNRIVTLDYDGRTARGLRVRCADSVSNGPEMEFWGHDHGDQWRVHLHRTEAS